jgi:hypothetical protein
MKVERVGWGMTAAGSDRKVEAAPNGHFFLVFGEYLVH